MNKAIVIACCTILLTSMEAHAESITDKCVLQDVTHAHHEWDEEHEHKEIEFMPIKVITNALKTRPKVLLCVRGGGSGSSEPYIFPPSLIIRPLSFYSGHSKNLFPWGFFYDILFNTI